MIGAIVGIAAAVTVLGAIALLFNRLVGARNRCRYAWSDVDALLVRRAQTIPRLADVVSASMTHERELFGEIAAARAGIDHVEAGPSDQREAAERRIGAAARQLIAVAEAYPQLRAVESATELIAALKDVEGSLSRARLVYNRTVKNYHDARGTFPSSLVAAAFRFAPERYFEDA